MIALGMGMALLARYGTPLARGVALAGCLLTLAVVLGLWVMSSRQKRGARQLVRQVIVPADAALGQRALRAAGLVDGPDTGSSPLSRELARIHLERLIARASLERVERAAQRRARRYSWLGAALGLFIVVLVTFGVREVLEGFDVLMARAGRAPVPMSWTDRLRVVAQPPMYLRAPPRRLLAGSLAMLPKGTELTLRARPLYPDRTLVVSDGEREQPFVSDGEGGVVAHYRVDRDASLVVAARFGNVLIPEPDRIEITAQPDEAPSVELEGAPKSLRLSELSRLELRWAAVDDHGVRQVDLVLRSGRREERRVLGTYDQDAAEQRGAYALLSTDPFLRSLYLPAQVSIEARDNDPVQGSKWGRSAAYEIVPTAVGELDAQRYLALTRARDRFVDALAVATVTDKTNEELLASRLEGAVTELEQTLGESYGGLRVPQGLRNFARGQLRLLMRQAAAGKERAPALGDMILALDSVLANVATRDAQQVAKVLSEVAEEAMVGASQARSLEGNPDAGIERLERALVALRAGAEQLQQLGALGNDLGSVALADLGRVSRAREQADYFHAELAARHLADRLRRPRPSFGVQGSGGGVEAGRGAAAEPSGEASNADQQFDELAWQIAELAREHAGAMGATERAVSEAQPELDAAALQPEAERRAAALRDAVSAFPMPGHSPESAEASAALAAEHTRAMAHNLEGLRLDEAVESGRRALDALREADARSRAEAFGPELAEARAVIEEQLHWAEQTRDAARDAARDGARQALAAPAALEEKLAAAADELADRGETESTPLPREMTDRLRQADQLMRQAARALREGEGEQGLTFQREAQRLLEHADQGTTQDPAESESESQQHDGPLGKQPEFGGEVPEAEALNAAEQFRRRVLENLGDGAAGRFAPAVKRYAEGLLR